jgi:malate dehydrogenase (oxaloacetate-decarboxylating)(NADP+)
MFSSAAHALARQVTESDLAQGSIYPALTRVREVSAHIATAVADVAYKRKLASTRKPLDVMAHVRSHMYDPRYRNFA